MVGGERSLESRELPAAYGSGAELLDSWSQNIKMAIVGQQRHKGRYQVPQW